MTRHVTYLITKASEQNGERWLNAWATTPRLDRHADIVDPAGAKFSLPIPLCWAHDTSVIVGAVPEASASSAGIRVRCKLTKGVAKADEAWALAQDGVLFLSIGFLPIRETQLPDGGYRYLEYEVTEVSLCAVPANADTRVSVGKSVVYHQKTEAREEKRPTARKASTPHTGLPDPEIFGHVIGTAIRESVAPLKKRIDALERANKELADAIEQRAFRYRGYWNDGMNFRKNDFVTDQGSLWVALFDTAERPTHQAASWRIAARKGKDAK